MKLQDRTILITGGGTGIGRAVALEAAAEGASVVLCGRRLEPLAEVVALVEGLGGQAQAVAGDVTIESDCQRIAEHAVSAFGSIDILFNNAGVIYREKPVHTTTLAEWEETFSVNVTGTFLMSKAVLPGMLARGSGSIVHNGSFVGLAGGEAIAAYSASKGAVVLLTRSMALDYASAGIRVNCVCPGSVETPMLEREMEEMGGAETVRPLFAQKHPLGRIGTPEEVAAAVIFLASDDAAFITGAALPIDGGRLA
ncbi:MAG: NAD(P)-dependent dehydrogenase (short-subunit alcohol dehydrogenase family) [Rhodothermales bacterium]|jgi:NAD(P)-dependent dehydrogenase (short-subunit alcohol dehydrogenase family)